jgi:hypothetical protein
VKPEIGVSRAAGRWIVEAMAGVWLFTDNTNFSDGHLREQDPIASVQAHVWYRFGPTMFLAADANFYRGGRSTVDGVKHLDVQRNARVGWTFSWALDQRRSLRAVLSAAARIRPSAATSRRSPSPTTTRGSRLSSLRFFRRSDGESSDLLWYTAFMADLTAYVMGMTTGSGAASFFRPRY